MRHHVVFTLECDGEAPPGLLVGIAEAIHACVKAAGKNINGSVTMTVCEDPELAKPEHLPPGTSITFSDVALRQHSALVGFGKESLCSLT
jgi:hypothetical protein